MLEWLGGCGSAVAVSLPASNLSSQSTSTGDLLELALHNCHVVYLSDRWHQTVFCQLWHFADGTEDRYDVFPYFI